MPTTDDILVGNLGDALQQAQRFLLSGIVSAALFVLLSMDAPDLIALRQKVDVPTFGKVAPGTAAFILFLAYLTFGLLANSAIGRIRKITSAITDGRIVEAALTRFSVVTIENPVMRAGTALLAPFVILVGYLLEQRRGAEPLDVFTVISGFAVLSAPYLVLAYRLLKPLMKVPQ